MAETLTERRASLEESGLRLDKCLRLWIPHLPQSLIEKAARKGQLRVEGTKAKPSARIVEGQRLAFPESFLSIQDPREKRGPKALTQAEQKWLKGLIIYENTDVVVLNKPAGIAVQGGTKQSKSLDAMMEAYYDACRPRLVHRLDRDTSGILVLAKNLPMARWLTKAFKERKVKKIYWALVCGVPQKTVGLISLPLAKKPDPAGEKVRVDKDEGLHATTFYQVLESLGNKLAWLELIPKTGRMHQLRVHCAEGLKTPILGDGKYGGKGAFPFGRQPLHLHAHSLTFPGMNGKMLTFEAPLPKEFQKTFKMLGLHVV